MSTFIGAIHLPLLTIRGVYHTTLTETLVMREMVITKSPHQISGNYQQYSASFARFAAQPLSLFFKAWQKEIL